MSSSTSDPRFGTLRLEARFDFFSLDTPTIGASSTWPVSRGSVGVVVSTLASMVIEVSSCDIVEIVSLYYVWTSVVGSLVSHSFVNSVQVPIVSNTLKVFYVIVIVG